jgi:hypothetical protein
MVQSTSETQRDFLSSPVAEPYVGQGYWVPAAADVVSLPSSHITSSFALR